MFGNKIRKYRQKTDEELILVYKDTSDNDCVGVLYERYGLLVMGTCLKYLKDKDLAEDMLMQIFEGLYVKLKQHQIDYFKSWLYRLSTNECLMHLRKSGKHIHTDLQLIQLREEESNEDPQETEKLIAHLGEAIQTLKQEQKICVELFYLQKRTYQEISDQLGIDLKQVKSAIQNGKRNLKLKLEAIHEKQI